MIYGSNDKLQHLTIVLDEREIYPNDPGMGTPAMVYLFEGSNEVDSGTFYCAVEAGELSENGTVLSNSQNAWLESKRQKVDDFITENMPVS